MHSEVSQTQTPTRKSDSNVDKVPSMKYTITFTNHPRKHIISHISLGAKEKGTADEASGLGLGQIHWTICDQTSRLLFCLSAGDRTTVAQTEKERLKRSKD